MGTTKTKSMWFVRAAIVTVFAAFTCLTLMGAQQAHAVDTSNVKHMLRLYNPNSGEHLFTLDTNEKNTLVKKGWKDEGISWITPDESSVDVYRLYNPNSGDHHYTIDKNEYEKLGKIGWNKEGIKYKSNNSKSTPIYRLFNPNATSGTHHYTTDKDEYDQLVKIGWKGENVGWYGSDYQAIIEVKNYGTITLSLDYISAPKTVENFAMLAEKGFYNGLTFHRIMKGFMMQGGDPAGNGTSGNGNVTIEGEFSKNGWTKNKISHKRGVISMARNGVKPPKRDEDYTSDQLKAFYNSASSQFFIVHQDSAFLDGDYAAFGKVTSGMKVVDSICNDKYTISENEIIFPAQQPVITKITVKR